MKYKTKIIDKLKWTFKTFHGQFVTLWLRPVKADNIQNCSYVTTQEKIGIILQGGIVDNYNFTIETIKLYKLHYPNAIIILSTWNDTPEKLIKQINALNIIVLFNKKPVPLPGNGNLQIVSTKAGIIAAKGKGCKYVCKTRTDQRMYATGIFPYLIKLMEKFPLKSNVDLKERIIILGSNTFRNRQYSVNDMWMFGLTEDLEKYWKCSSNMQWDEEIINNFKDKRVTEAYLCLNFLREIKYSIEWNHDDYLNVLKSLFIVIDLQSIDLYFVKRAKEYFNKSYNDKDNIEFSFRDWMAIQ